MNLEAYEDAARIKVAIAAAATNDSVGRVMSHLNVWFFPQMTLIRWKESILLYFPFYDLMYILNLLFIPLFQSVLEKEQYSDAAFLRDKAGAGLVSMHKLC